MDDNDMILKLKMVRDQIDSRDLTAGQAQPLYLDLILRLRCDQLNYLIRQALDNQGIA